MEKEDLGMRPNCHLLGFGDDDTSPSLCHFRKWPITSLPWNWVRSMCPKRHLLALREQSVRGVWIYESEPRNAGCGGTHLATRCSLAAQDEEAWSKGGHGRFRGRWRVGAGAKVNKESPHGFGLPSQERKGVHYIYLQDHWALSKLLKLELTDCSSINIQSLVWGQWHLKSYLNRKSTALK